MNNGDATTHIGGDRMDREQVNNVQFNQIEMMDISTSNDFQELSFASHDGYLVSNLDDISPSIPLSVFSTTERNNSDIDMEQIVDDYLTTETPFESHHETEQIEMTEIEILPSIPQPVVSTNMNVEMETNLEEMNYFQETERPFAANSGRYSICGLNERFPAAQRSVCSTPAHSETRANFREMGNDDRMEKPLESHTANLTEGSPKRSFEELIDADRASTSFGDLCASAGPSSGRDLIEQCEPMGREAHRRSQEWYYVCPACEKRCHCWSVLGTHFRIHTNERPYPCNECVRKFNTKYELNKHRRRHHTV